MKRILKTVAAGAAVACALCLAGCGGGKTKYTGDYHYDTEYGVYGVKVEVEVMNGIVKDVDIISSHYEEVTDIWDGKENYLQNREAMLESFEGKSVQEILSYTVSTETDGTPAQISAGSLKVVSGATQCSGRLILAVQDALKKV